MTTEKRLIDANALESGIAKMFRPYVDGTYPGDEDAIKLAETLVDVLELINEQPTVYAEEVVRCDDCIHYKEPEEGDYLGLCTSGMLSVSHNGEIYPGRGFFCLYGERKKI